jgi:hypothetical protein
MSWHYVNSPSSQGLEEASWEGPSLDGAPDALLRLMPTHEASSLQDSGTDACPDSRSGMTSRPSTGDLGAAPSMSSAADFLARTSAQPAREPGSPGRDPVCGATWRELLVKWDLDSSSWKTHQCLFTEDLPWSSVTLPNWGMMRSGVCWERATPSGITAIRARITKGLASGFSRFPTPCLPGNGGSNGKAKLRAMLRWATPSAQDWKDSPGMAKTGTNPDGSERKREDQLARQVYVEETGGSLNPTWVEWLMGWPLRWTSLDPMPLALWAAWVNAFQNDVTASDASATDRSP